LFGNKQSAGLRQASSKRWRFALFKGKFMNTTHALVKEILEIMTIRMNSLWFQEEHKIRWSQALQKAKELQAGNDDLGVIIALIEVMNMQDKRETGEFHIPANTAKHMWDKAYQSGEAYLRRINTEMAAVASAQGAGPTDAEGYIKQRAAAISRAGCTLKHSQILQALARSEGYKSFQALKAALPQFGPAFCPHCGAAGTLKNVGTVFCEQGEWDGKSHEAEGDGVQYRCDRCSGQFTDWSGIEPAPSVEEPTTPETFDVNLYESFNDWINSNGSNLGTFEKFDEAVRVAHAAYRVKPYTIRIIDNRTGKEVDF
jgi:hypothetical protein